MQNSKKYIIWAPSFQSNVGGITVLHKLCDMINKKGYEAYLWPADDDFGTFQTCLKYNTPLAKREFVTDAIVIYPEVAFGNPLNAKNVVRWLLNKPGVAGGDGIFGKDDMIFYFSNAFCKSGTECRYLQLLELHNELFSNYNLPKFGSCYVKRKGHLKELAHDVSNSIEIVETSPSLELAELFNKKEYFYSYDEATFLSLQAAMCGCVSVIIPRAGLSAKEWYKMSPTRKYGISYGYEDIDHARSTMDKVKPHLEYLQSMSELMLDDFIETTQKCAELNITTGEYDAKVVNLQGLKRQIKIQTLYNNLFIVKKLLTRATKINPNDKEVKESKKLLDENRKKLEAESKHVLNFEPSNAMALNDISTAELLEEKYQEALVHIKEVLNIDKDNKTAISNLVYLRDRVDELKQSKGLGASTPVNKPITERDVLLEAEKLIESKKYDKAEEQLNKILQWNSKNIDALNDLAVVSILEQNYSKAQNIIEYIFRIEPNNEVAQENYKYLVENKLIAMPPPRGIALNYMSHIGQDAWVAECMQYKKGGFFLDFGAFDGKTISNTYMLEKDLEWKGICVEPNPRYFNLLCERRNVITVNVALWPVSRQSLRFVDAHGLSGLEEFADKDCMAETRNKIKKDVIEVDTISPNELLKRFNAPRLIEFMSLDVEGCEFEILSAIDLSYYSIALMAIEHNHDKARQKQYREYLAGYGYEYVQNRNDDWFFHRAHLAACLPEGGGNVDPVAIANRLYDTYPIKE